MYISSLLMQNGGRDSKSFPWMQVSADRSERIELDNVFNEDDTQDLKIFIKQQTELIRNSMDLNSKSCFSVNK